MAIYTRLVEGEPVDTRRGEEGYQIKVAQKALGGIKAAVGRRVELVLDPSQVLELAKEMLGKLPARSVGKRQANELLAVVKAITA